MRRLDLIVPHYREPWEVGKPFFDMIAMQRNVDLREARVILVNDGAENALPEACFAGYPYKIRQMSIEKGGVSKARNAGLEAAGAEWVMFCDFDDMFSDIYGLWRIFRAVEGDRYDTVWSVFTEEVKLPDGRIEPVTTERDFTFVHGKVHRRKYLTENGIRFHEKLTIHEDAYLNVLAQLLAKEGRVGSILTPFYTYRWNDESVVRKNGTQDTFLLDTFGHLVRQWIALTEEFKRRGEKELGTVQVLKSMMDMYYNFQNPAWRTQAAREKNAKASRWAATYLTRYMGVYRGADRRQVADIAAHSRENAMKERRFFMEFETVPDFMNRIVRNYRPMSDAEIDL